MIFFKKKKEKITTTKEEKNHDYNLINNINNINKNIQYKTLSNKENTQLYLEMNQSDVPTSIKPSAPSASAPATVTSSSSAPSTVTSSVPSTVTSSAPAPSTASAPAPSTASSSATVTRPIYYGNSAIHTYRDDSYYQGTCHYRGVYLGYQTDFYSMSDLQTWVDEDLDGVDEVKDDW